MAALSKSVSSISTFLGETGTATSLSQPTPNAGGRGRGNGGRSVPQISNVAEVLKQLTTSVAQMQGDLVMIKSTLAAQVLTVAGETKKKTHARADERVGRRFGHHGIRYNGDGGCDYSQTHYEGTQKKPHVRLCC